MKADTTTILVALDAALRAVVDADEGECTEPTGLPTYEGEMLDLDGLTAKGRVPAKIGWTTDRGRWMWDGALAVARGLGLNVNAKIER